MSKINQERKFIPLNIAVLTISDTRTEESDISGKRLVEMLEGCQHLLFEKKIVPNFLVEVDDNKIDKKNLIKGLKLVGDYLDKNILKPNNINYPSSRLDFINILK